MSIYPSEVQMLALACTRNTMARARENTSIVFLEYGAREVAVPESILRGSMAVGRRKVRLEPGGMVLSATLDFRSVFSG